YVARLVIVDRGDRTAIGRGRPGRRPGRVTVTVNEIGCCTWRVHWETLNGRADSQHAISHQKGHGASSSSRSIQARIYGGQLRSVTPSPSHARRKLTVSRSTRTRSLRSSTRGRPAGSAASSADSSLALPTTSRPLKVRTTS